MIVGRDIEICLNCHYDWALMQSSLDPTESPAVFNHGEPRGFYGIT
jgi:hypothetical protein